MYTALNQAPWKLKKKEGKKEKLPYFSQRYNVNETNKLMLIWPTHFTSSASKNGTCGKERKSKILLKVSIVKSMGLASRAPGFKLWLSLPHYISLQVTCTYWPCFPNCKKQGKFLPHEFVVRIKWKNVWQALTARVAHHWCLIRVLCHYRSFIGSVSPLSRLRTWAQVWQLAAQNMMTRSTERVWQLPSKAQTSWQSTASKWHWSLRGRTGTMTWLSRAGTA